MRSSPFRLALPLAALLAALPLGRLIAADAAPAAPATTAAKETVTPAPAAATADTPAPAAPAAAPTPAPAAAPAVVDQDTADAKLAVVLRSFSLMQEENDRFKVAQEKSDLERSALEAQLAEAKKALPLAAQTVGLREQLRQTQDQLAAVSLENNELKTRLATGAPTPGKLTPVAVPTNLAPAVLPAPAPTAPEVKYHVVAAGDTLGKISRQYYGTASRWPEILAANKDVLKNENSLLVGTKLRIP